MERVGRVSDTCTVAGNYADRLGAVSCTGIGEDIVDAALATRLVHGLEHKLGLKELSDRILLTLREHAWRAGYIAVDHRGNWVADRTTESLYWAVRNDEGEEGFWKERN
jgi:L-asparaginase